MDAYINKKYKLKHSENFEEYLIFLGLGIFKRKIIMALSPVSTLTKNEDGSYTFIMSTPLRNIEMQFNLDEEFIEERPDGAKLKSVMKWDGNQLIQTQIEKCGRKSTHIREFRDKIMTVTTTGEGWDGTCIRTYELVD